MIKFVAEMEQGILYGFGLTEANLNRMEFNNEPIFFDFGYAGSPELFGLVLYMGQFQSPLDIAQNAEVLEQYCTPFLNPDRGVTFESLRVFPLAQSVMKKFRSTPFWAMEAHIPIKTDADVQMFFAGRDEQNIEKYFQDAGFISPKTKRTYKGFGKPSL